VLQAANNLYQRGLRCAKVTHQGYAQPLDARRPEDLPRMLSFVADYICDARHALELLRKPVSRQHGGIPAAAAAAGRADA
jgi:hypothetical protein